MVLISDLSDKILKTRSVDELIELIRKLEEKIAHGQMNNEKMIMNSSFDLFFVIDSLGHIVDCNSHLEDYLGKSLEILKGESIEIYLEDEGKDFIGKVKNSNNVDSFKGALRIGISEEIPIIYRVTKLNKDILISIKDISEIHELSEKLEKARLEENSNNSDYVQLYTMGLSHEINNILNVITGRLEWVRKEITDADNKNFLSIEKSLSALRDIAQNMRLRAKEEDDEKIDIHFLLNRLSYFIKKHFKNRKIKLSHEFLANSNFVHGNYNKLQSAFLNILNNSCEAVEEKKEVEIEITTMNFSDMINIHIKDNGLGLKQEDVSKIFLPFYSTKELSNHKGMGLTVSKAIIEEHHGGLGLMQENKGTHIVVTLPVTD